VWRNRVVDEVDRVGKIVDRSGIVGVVSGREDELKGHEEDIIRVEVEMLLLSSVGRVMSDASCSCARAESRSYSAIGLAIAPPLSGCYPYPLP
jgi:hypothetical protein